MPARLAANLARVRWPREGWPKAGHSLEKPLGAFQRCSASTCGHHTVPHDLEGCDGIFTRLRLVLHLHTTANPLNGVTVLVNKEAMRVQLSQ